MKGRLAAGTFILALALQITCSSAHAVTWFDSSIRPDGVGDAANNGQTYAAPAEEGGQIVYGNQDGEVVGGDAFDSTAGE